MSDKRSITVGLDRISVSRYGSVEVSGEIVVNLGSYHFNRTLTEEEMALLRPFIRAIEARILAEFTGQSAPDKEV